VEADGRCGATASAQWGFPSYRIGPSRVCGESCSTAIVGSRAPATPLYLCGAAQRGGPLLYMASAPDQGADGIGFPISEIFPKGRRSHS
jgi:hypothetical protein